MQSFFCICVTKYIHVLSLYVHVGRKYFYPAPQVTAVYYQKKCEMQQISQWNLGTQFLLHVTFEYNIQNVILILIKF